MNTVCCVTNSILSDRKEYLVEDHFYRIEGLKGLEGLTSLKVYGA
ncbi:hypothetical protein TDB9533_03136 [Thalassocella blandensis]|nr:hypothetical protein TDB9533_03136 [Thalassocella blandensis]